MKKIIIFSLSVILFYACHEDALIDVSDHSEIQAYNFTENEIVKGRVRIKLEELTGIRALDNLASALGITRIERTFPHAGKFEERTRKEGLHLWYDAS